MIRFALVAVCALSLSGCANRTEQAQPATSTTAGASAGGQVYGTPARGSKFARLQLGMPMKQVFDLIGAPTDTSAHVTGKMFIPFYFGGDSVRSEAYYRGEGQLTFTRSSIGTSVFHLYAIHVDRAESGYAH